MTTQTSTPNISQIMTQNAPSIEHKLEGVKSVMLIIEIAFILLGLILGSFAAFNLSEQTRGGWDDEVGYYEVDVPVHIFGVEIKCSTEKFMSPAMAFVWIAVATTIVGFVVSYIILAIFINIKVKEELLNNVYRTSLLTQLLLQRMQGDQAPEEKDDIPSQDSAEGEDLPQKQDPIPAVKVQKTSYGKIICPNCGAEQLDNRKVCFRCDTPFEKE